MSILYRRAWTRALLSSCVTLSCCVAAAQSPPDPSTDTGGGAETVIVTARRLPGEPAVVAAARERLARTPGAVSVVAAEAYATRFATGMPDLLAGVAGIVSNKRYGEEARLSIRGSGIGQSFHQRGVLIAQDGIPFADADGFSDFQKVDALSARYVEVYKGGNALRFGGAQLGGAINLVTPTGRTAPYSGLLRVEGGSFGTLRGHGAVAHAGETWDVYASTSAARAEGYRDHSVQDQLRGTLNLGASFGEGREVRLIVFGADVAQEVPGTLTLADALNDPKKAGAGVIANDWSRDQSVGRISLQTRWRFDDALSVEGGVYATATDLRHPIPIVLEQDIHTLGAFARIDWTGAIAGRRADLFAGFSYRAGANDQQTYVNAGGRNGMRIGDARQKASGLDLFAEGRWFVSEQLALVAGGSFGIATRDYQNRLNAANDASKDFDWFAPRIGMLWESASGIQVYANLTRSVEPPHYGALVQSPFPGFVPVEAQTAWTGEIGTRGRSGALTWDIALYRAELEGELLGFTVQPGIPAAVFNAGDTVHQGIEASLDWRILDGDTTLTLRQTWAWSDFRFRGDAIYGDNRLPVVPQHQYRAALRYEHASGFFVEPAIAWRPQGVFVDYANTLKAPSYALLNLQAGWRFESGVTVFLDARNLADKTHVAEFGAVTDARVAQTAVFYPGEGRALFGGVSFSF